MAYPERETALRENANYVRSWITHGLIDASLAGNNEALPLIRGHLDWFNHCEYLSQVVDRNRGYIPDHWIPYQGMISSTRMYLSPLGKPDDLDLIRDHYQEDWWLTQLLARDDKAIYDRPESHCYEITAFEAYLDLYRITGEMKYLHSVLNAWEMLRDKWEMPGGSWALCERRRYPPKSYQLGVRSRSGELCCAVFWVKLNQRLHLLFPDNEVFVSEIEKSIYNAGIGNQVGESGISYHTILEGKKDEPVSPPQGTCCEGQGTRLFGSLPEYLYSLSPAGIYVDIYASSEISWRHGKYGGETDRGYDLARGGRCEAKSGALTAGHVQIEPAHSLVDHTGGGNSFKWPGMVRGHPGELLSYRPGMEARRSDFVQSGDGFSHEPV